MLGTLYVRWLGLVAAAFVVSASAFKAFIDPYGIFGSLDLPDVNTKKAYAHHHARLAKEQRVVRLQPRTVVIGNSRVDVGIDPLSGEWPATMRPVANLGVPGEGVDGSLVSLRFVLENTQATTVVLGLDFTDFLLQERTGEPASYSRSILHSSPQTLRPSTRLPIVPKLYLRSRIAIPLR